MEEEFKEAIETLERVQEEIFELMNEAAQALRDSGIIETRAHSYWIPHIMSAAGHEDGNPYDQSITTTIKELKEAAEQYDTF